MRLRLSRSIACTARLWDRPTTVLSDLRSRRCRRLRAIIAAQHSELQSSESGLLLSAADLENTFTKVRSVIATRNELVSFEANFNVALLIWRLIASLHPEERPTLVDRFTPGDIKELWQLAAARYAAQPADVQSSTGPWKSPWNDLPEDKGQEIIYKGKAAVPLSGLFGHFEKAFFLHPDTYEVYGRVRLKPGVLGDTLYPLYFKCTPKQTVIPDTGELADMSLEYLSGDSLALRPESLPSAGRWPQPALDHRWPFNGGLVDYVRPVGPGVYVGVGWKLGKGARGKQFLYFIMAHVQASA